MNATRRTAGSTILFFFLVVAVPGYAATRPPASIEREVRFQNDGVELVGTLLLPAEDRSPAIVYLHGSGPMTRAGFRPHAEAFAKLGVASLFFDKRGTGASGGSWVTSSLDHLAGDALAAVEHLKTEPRVDPDRIGLWAISQGGWIAPVAAARSQDISFMIVVSGGGASPRESELFSYGQNFEAAGLIASQRAEGFGLVEQYFEYLGTGAGRPDLAARLDEMSAGPEQPLNPLAGQLLRILPSLENRSNWSWVANYDPAPDIASLKCPVLLLFGDRDRDQPTQLAATRWTEGLSAAANDRLTVMIFPGAAHGIRMQQGHEAHHRAPFADGYWEVQFGWLWRHVLAPDP